MISYAQQSLSNTGIENASSIKSRALSEIQFGVESFEAYDYDAAFVHYSNAQELYASINDTINQASMLLEMGWIDAFNERYAEAIAYYQEAYRIYATDAKYMDKQLDLLRRIRDIYHKQGDTENFAKVTHTINSKLTKSIDQLVSLAQDMEFQGKLNDALLYYKEAYNNLDTEGLHVENIAQYQDICTQLMIISYRVENFEDALNYEKELRAIEREFDIEPTHITTFLRDLVVGKSLIGLKREEAALEHVESLHQKYGNSTFEIERALPYDIASLAFLNFGKYAQAFDNTVKADSVLAISQPEDGQERISFLYRKICILSDMGRHEEAVQQFLHLMELKQRVYEENQDEYINDLRQLANYEAYSGAAGNEGHKENAKTHMSQCVAIEINDIKNQAPWLTPEQRTNLWSKVQFDFQQLAGFAIGLNLSRDKFTVDVYNAHVFASGLLLQTERALADAIRKNGTADDVHMLEELELLKETSDKDLNKVNPEVQIRIQSLESQLIQNTAELADYKKFLAMDFDSIHAQLRPGEVLIDFSENRHIGNNDKSVCAFILRPEWDYPQLMRVCRYSDIDKISDTLGASIYENGASQELRHLLVDSLLHYVHPGERVYYVPAGIVHGVAIENLLTDEGYYLSSVYDFWRLSSAREVVGIHEKSHALKSAVLYGGLSYGDYSQEDIARAHTSDMPYQEERGLADAYTKLRTSAFEVKSIRSILKKASVNSVLLQNEDGTEESFMELDRQSPDVIHLATHGYYLSSEQARKVKGLDGYAKAMQLSGLIMSGGNAGWLGIPTPDGVLDGLLSAEDISKLDLSNAKLVVLSACKTAKGTTSPEGIFGLQRALKKAGARSLILTLWNAHDEVTTLFMTEFYKELVKRKWDKHAAFNKARETIRSNTKYQEPYYWAGFILLD